MTFSGISGIANTKQQKRWMQIVMAKGQTCLKIIGPIQSKKKRNVE